ncbi:MAG: TonB C-terminal domain-containing protein [Acidobacteriota bacterium]
MTTMATSTFGAQASDSGLNRAIIASLAVHVAAAGFLFFAPREWLAKKTPPPAMTISLGGTLGPRTTGTTSIGGRTVEKVAPPPKRQETIKPTPKEENVALVPMKATPRPKATKTPPPEAAARVPVTGPQVTQGNTAVETGARGQGVGLTFGGGGTGGEEDLKSFCCPEYLAEMTSEISSHWSKIQQEKGVTILKFTILRDGAIVDVVTEKTSGSGVLDRASQRALLESRLTALPAEFKFEKLTVHLNFPYGTQ